MFCRVISGNGKIEFESASSISTDLDDMIKDDVKYGKLVPKNGEYFTWAIGDPDDELTKSLFKKAVADACFGLYLEFDIRFKRTEDFDNADIRVIFASEEENKLLTPNTIALMYYPLGSANDGLCIINKRFVFTQHGNAISGKEMLRLGIKVQFVDGSYATIDLDQILRHEFVHGVLGLPHDPKEDNVMFGNESGMAEHFSIRDITRGSAKVGRRTMLKRKYARLKAWFVGSGSER